MPTVSDMLALYLAAGWVAAASPAPDLNPAQLQVIERINATGPAIDRCVTRYLAEYPEARGRVALSVVVGEAGRVTTARASTQLPGARHLRPCLQQVARGWKLPPPEAEQARLNLQVSVRKGAKFRLKKPGEERRRAPSKDDEKDEGFYKMQPAGWGFTPSGW